MTDCRHCRLPTPAPHLEFCCVGCETAFSLIAGHGLADYYRLRPDAQPLASRSGRQLDYGDFDRPDLLERFSRRASGGGHEITLGVAGMHCAACVWLIERLPRMLDGVDEARVNWGRSTVEVRWDPQRAGLGSIARTLDRLGYRPHVLEPGVAKRSWTADERRRLTDLGVAGALAGNVMLLAIALYLGALDGMSPSAVSLLRWTSCVLGMVALVGPGRVFFVGAAAAWRARTPHMDLPIALGLGVGGMSGVVHTILGRGEIYFDSLTVLVFLLLVGRAAQRFQQRRAVSAVEVLGRLTPKNAHRWTEQGSRDVPTVVLRPGDLVEVHPGEVIPADGVVIFGESSIDGAVLTGESTPTRVGPSDEVTAGATNLVSGLRVEVRAVGEDTRMGQVLASVEGAGERPAIVELADRVGRVFVGVALGMALLTLVVWLAIDPAVAADHATSLLIVACPCALALATPLSISVGLARASQREILVKGGDVLQRLSRPGVLWLDKTGTITCGRMRVTAWAGDPDARALASALQRCSTHPIATAFGGDADTRGEDPGFEVTSVVRETQGLRGVVDGRTVLVGNEAYLREAGISMRQALVDQAADGVGRGCSPVFVAVEGRLVAVAEVSDPVRDDARESISELAQDGWTLGIASGDHPEVVRRVAEQVGIDPARAHGGLLPEDKVALVRRSEPCVMVGDGVNDSAALAAADVGIAVHGGAEASLLAASVYLGRPGLAGVVDLHAGARKTMRVIRRNFVLSLGYNAVAMSLAVAGWVTPWLAAILMPLSSLSVVGSSLAMTWPTRGHR